MQIEINGKSFVRGLGWTIALLFWLALFTITVSLISAPGDSGAGYVVMGLFFAIAKTFPLLLLPLAIVIYGVRKNHEFPLWKVLLKWGTIATAVYLFFLFVSFIYISM